MLLTSLIVYSRLVLMRPSLQWPVATNIPHRVLYQRMNHFQCENDSNLPSSKSSSTPSRSIHPCGGMQESSDNQPDDAHPEDRDLGIEKWPSYSLWGVTVTVKGMIQPMGKKSSQAIIVFLNYEASNLKGIQCWPPRIQQKLNERWGFWILTTKVMGYVQ